MNGITNEGLLTKLEDIIRSQPPYGEVRRNTPENRGWVGRAVAAVGAWDVKAGEQARRYAALMRNTMARDAYEGVDGLINLIYEARSSLRLNIVGPVNAAIGQGLVFDYFDEIRKIIAMAHKDILFVDPYLDADFVSRYLPHVQPGLTIRLLAREKMATLLPAVVAFVQQHRASIEVRTSSGFHDRYVLIDGAACYQSGASFKDGGRNAPTTVTQIADAFPAVRDTYEDLWKAGTSVFP